MELICDLKLNNSSFAGIYKYNEKIFINCYEMQVNNNLYNINSRMCETIYDLIYYYETYKHKKRNIIPYIYEYYLLDSSKNGTGDVELNLQSIWADLVDNKIYLNLNVNYSLDNEDVFVNNDEHEPDDDMYDTDVISE